MYIPRESNSIYVMFEKHALKEHLVCFYIQDSFGTCSV
jgi:hypothetical protein